MRIRVIRVAARDFTPITPAESAKWLTAWKEAAAEGTQLEMTRVTRGVETVECIYDREFAAPFILKEVERAEEDGVDAAIIHCMADPALDGAREMATIPVVGEGLACFSVAINLGRRFSIIAPGKQAIPLYERNVRAYGLLDHLASVRPIGIPVTRLREDPNALKDAVVEQGQLAIEHDGAEVIVPGCGEIYGLSKELTQALNVPVLDPVKTVVAYTEMLVKLSLTCSKKAYPCPPPKRRQI